MSSITTHVLDTSLGAPAAGVHVTLSLREGTTWRELSRSLTDSDGRVREFGLSEPLTPGTHQLAFETALYFRASGRDCFFERVCIEFKLAFPSTHYHVPLLLSPFGYTTYRGS